MKNRIFTTGLLLLGISWGTAQTKLSKAEKTEFIVSGNCEMCKKRIEQATLAVKGVKMVTWDIPSNVLSVIYNAKKQDLNAIHEAIAAAMRAKVLQGNSDFAKFLLVVFDGGFRD